METTIKLTKLASCAGCGAKVGAGTLVQMLEEFRTHKDPRLIVGYDKSDDARIIGHVTAKMDQWIYLDLSENLVNERQ